MKRTKVNGRLVPGTDRQHEILFEGENEGGTSDSKGQEVSRARMLENLKLALFFCRAQGRMARGEQ